VRSWRQTGSGQGKAAYDLALVLDPDTAKARAEQAHRDVWAARNTLTGLTAPPRANSLTAGESLDVLLGGAWRRLNLTAIRVRANGLVEWDAVVEEAAVWTPHSAEADSGTLPPNTAPAIVGTVWYPLNLPMLAPGDDDAGFYVAAGGPAGWRAASIQRSADGANFAELVYLNQRAVLGVCTSVLGNGPHAGWDRASTPRVSLALPAWA
jgi:hypothetical protein